MTCKGGYNNGQGCTSSVACPGGICMPFGVCISVSSGYLPCSRCGDCPYGYCVIGMGVCVNSGQPCNSPQDCYNNCSKDLCICSPGSCHYNLPNTTQPSIPQTTIPSTTTPSSTFPNPTIPQTTTPSPTATDPSTTSPVTTTPPTTLPITTPPITTYIETTIPPTTIPETTNPQPITTLPPTTIPLTTLPTTTAPNTNNSCVCSHNHTYWMINYQSWSSNYTNTTFCNVKWIVILNMTTTTDPFVILAKQLIAIYLNTYNCLPSHYIKTKIEKSTSLILSLCSGTGWSKKFCKSKRDKLISYSAHLDDYNNGRMSPVVRCIS